MRKRPFLLFLSSLLFLYFPLQLVYQHLKGIQVPISDWIISGGLPLLLVGGLVRVTKLGWYTLVGFILLWGVRDLALFYSEQASSAQVLIHVGIYLFSLTYFINPRIRHLYFDPKLRWWRTKNRFETHLPVLYEHRSQWSYPILRNISEGGCFIETPHPVPLSDVIKIIVPLPIPLGKSSIETVGEVRWVSNHPLKSGMGIQFRDLSPADQKAVQEFVHRQL